MLLARVIGSVVATQKHAKFQGAKLLVVQPCVAKDGVLTESGNTGGGRRQRRRGAGHLRALHAGQFGG